MKIKWKGELWEVKYYEDGYPRWVLEQGPTTFAWLLTAENNFQTEEEFVKFLREGAGEGKNYE